MAHRRSSSSMRNAPSLPSKLRRRKQRCSQSSAVMFAPLATSRKPHQTATGFDQASQSTPIAIPSLSRLVHATAIVLTHWWPGGETLWQRKSCALGEIGAGRILTRVPLAADFGSASIASGGRHVHPRAPRETAQD